MFKVNEGKTDRIIRVLLGLVLLLLGLSLRGGFEKTLFYVFGVLSLVTGITGFCGIYSLLGINTCPVKLKSVKSKKKKK